MKHTSISSQLKPVCAAALLLLPACAAQAQTFGEAVQRARETEPTFVGVKANAMAAQQRSRMAFAGLLPQLNATATTNTNRREYQTRGEPPVPPAIDNYNSNNAQLNLTQPLFRPSNVIALRQAETAVTQADFQILAAEQELLAKLAAAWFDAMAARDSMLFTSRQAATQREQWQILRRGVELGTASAPAAEEARARYQQALAEESAAEMEFRVRAAGLEQIIGPSPQFRPPFVSARPAAFNPGGETLEAWIERAERGPQVQAAQQALNAAEDEVRKQRAGYAPTLDVVGSYGRNAQAVGNFPGQAGYEIRQGTIGLQLNMPLYTGGAQFAKVDEAIALREKARQDLIAAQRAARLAAQQAWYAWQAADTRRGAALHAGQAALIALRAADTGLSAGVKTQLDRLQAQQQLEGARRDLSKAHYDLVLGFFRLKTAAGALADEDLQATERLFSPAEPGVVEMLAIAVPR